MAYPEMGGIEQDFMAAYAAAGRPADMALFVRHVSEGRLHCDVLIYFPPAAADVAHRAGADPCERPPCQGLGLLAGPREAWAALFPEG